MQRFDDLSICPLNIPNTKYSRKNMALAVGQGARLRELSLTEERAVLLEFHVKNKCSRDGGPAEVSTG